MAAGLRLRVNLAYLAIKMACQRRFGKTISSSARLGIKAVTLFAFSSENWRRPEEEVGVLMELFYYCTR